MMMRPLPPLGEGERSAALCCAATFPHLGGRPPCRSRGRPPRARPPPANVTNGDGVAWPGGTPGSAAPHRRRLAWPKPTTTTSLAGSRALGSTPSWRSCLLLVSGSCFLARIGHPSAAYYLCFATDVIRCGQADTRQAI
jgi:hypothetical protein